MITRARDYGKIEIPSGDDWIEAQFLAYYGQWNYQIYRKTPKHLTDKVFILWELKDALDAYQAKQIGK